MGHRARILAALAAADFAVCAVDSEAAKYACDELFRAAARPWTLGEVLSGGVAGWVHRFAVGGPCYGCVASRLGRELPAGDPLHPMPDYAHPAGQVPATTVPASKASVATVAGLHALVTLDLLADPAAAAGSWLVPLALVPGLFAEPFRGRRFDVARDPACLVCGTPAAGGRPGCARGRGASAPGLSRRAAGSPARRACWRSSAAPRSRAATRAGRCPGAPAASGWPRPCCRRGGGRGGFALAGPTPVPLAPCELAAAGAALRLTFRLPTPRVGTAAALTWRGRTLARVNLTVVGEADYRAGLVAESGVTARLGPHAVAAESVVARQCRGLVAALTLRHDSGLTPLTALGVGATYARPGAVPLTTPVELDLARLAGNSVTLAVALPSPGRGRAAVIWRVGGAAVASNVVVGTTFGRFRDGVRVAESGFVLDAAGTAQAVRHPPPRFEGAVGPRFALAGTPGHAGRVRYEVRATGRDGPIWSGTALVTGEPTPLPLGLVPGGADLAGFELRVGGQLLGTVLARPVPSATFTAEGKFAPPPDFPWTSAADDELGDRLGRLG